MASTFSDWLDARDGETLARAWSELDVTSVEAAAPGWDITLQGAAQLAAAFLGWPIEKLAWLARLDEEMPPPSFQIERSTERCFVELAVDRNDHCYEEWEIRELCEGPRGVQCVSVTFQYDDGTREGGGGRRKVVRVFDRATRVGASMCIGWRSLATIGEIDITALDLFSRFQNFSLPAWKQYDPDGVRGVLAQLASEVDAHFDVSTTWPARAIGSLKRFESGGFAVELSEHRFPRNGGGEDGWVIATVHGLPWGYAMKMTVWDENQIYGMVELRLPLALGEAVLARLALVFGVVI